MLTRKNRSTVANCRPLCPPACNQPKRHRPRRPFLRNGSIGLGWAAQLLEPQQHGEHSFELAVEVNLTAAKPGPETFSAKTPSAPATCAGDVLLVKRSGCSAVSMPHAPTRPWPSATRAPRAAPIIRWCSSRTPRRCAERAQAVLIGRHDVEPEPARLAHGLVEPHVLQRRAGDRIAHGLQGRLGVDAADDDPCQRVGRKRLWPGLRPQAAPFAFVRPVAGLDVEPARQAERGAVFA